VVELAYTEDLKSSDESYESSNLSGGIRLNKRRLIMSWIDDINWLRYSPKTNNVLQIFFDLWDDSIIIKRKHGYHEYKATAKRDSILTQLAEKYNIPTL
jgi:hypothetical protein